MFKFTWCDYLACILIFVHFTHQSLPSSTYSTVICCLSSHFLYSVHIWSYQMDKAWIESLRAESRVSFRHSLFSSERNRHIHDSSKRGNMWKCPFPSLSPPSPLSWRCLQWERPNALLEERERFIKDWRDRALSVFYWRLPAFLWACLLQQYWYVRLGHRGSLGCSLFGSNQRVPKRRIFHIFQVMHSKVMMGTSS